jgi:hypothetical protein
LTTTDDAPLTLLSYTPVMGELNEAVADLNVQFVGIVGGEMRFSRVAHADPVGQAAPAAAAEVAKGGALLDQIIERIGAHPELVEQIKGVDSISLRD